MVDLKSEEVRALWEPFNFLNDEVTKGDLLRSHKRHSAPSLGYKAGYLPNGKTMEAMKSDPTCAQMVRKTNMMEKTARPKSGPIIFIISFVGNR